MVSLDQHTIRFSADLGSGTLINLERENRAAIEVIAAGNFVYLIKRGDGSN